MRPLRRDQCAFRIAVIRFFATQDREASEGAMAALWSGEVHMGAR